MNSHTFNVYFHFYHKWFSETSGRKGKQVTLLASQISCKDLETVFSRFHFSRSSAEVEPDLEATEISFPEGNGSFRDGLCGITSQLCSFPSPN